MLLCGGVASCCWVYASQLLLQQPELTLLHRCFLEGQQLQDFCIEGLLSAAKLEGSWRHCRQQILAGQRRRARRLLVYLLLLWLLQQQVQQLGHLRVVQLIRHLAGVGAFAWEQGLPRECRVCTDCLQASGQGRVGPISTNQSATLLVLVMHRKTACKSHHRQLYNCKAHRRCTDADGLLCVENCSNVNLIFVCNNYTRHGEASYWYLLTGYWYLLTSFASPGTSFALQRPE